MGDGSVEKWSAKIPLTVGVCSLICLVLGVGLWSVMTQISGAVIASGQIQVEAKRQVIQHPTGGVVGKINVVEGSVVQAGDVVVQFDDASLRSELSIIESQYFELLARKALFEAERDDLDALTYDEDFTRRAQGDEDLQDLVDRQSDLFKARLASLQKQKEQLSEQKEQLGSQVEGVNAQKEASQVQLGFIEEELKASQILLDKGLAQASRVLSLRREKARISGQVGNFLSELGRLRAAINGINIQILRLDTERRTSATENLRDTGYRSLELAERRNAILDNLSRLDVRAPMSGIIYDNKVFALQSVVRSAEPMMYIIPKDLPLVVQARIDTVHIDQVYLGQEATLNFAAFSQRTTPQIFGTVTKLSADVFTDQVSGLSYYQVELAPKAGEMDKLSNLELLPGMPVDAFLKTDERSAFTYLIKPVSDYFNRAFREE